MDTQSEHRLDVSGGKATLTNSTSTEAMLKDLRKLNPTYASDLAVNQTLRVDAEGGASLASPTSVTSGRSPANKRYVKNLNYFPTSATTHRIITPKVPIYPLTLSIELSLFSGLNNSSSGILFSKLNTNSNRYDVLVYLKFPPFGLFTTSCHVNRMFQYKSLGNRFCCHCSSGNAASSCASINRA